MDKPFKYPLPSPNFDKSAKDTCKSKHHYLTPSGMSLLPREKQPPPMYGKHGATLPARYLQQVVKGQQFPIPAEKQYCEPCELELYSFEELTRHRAQHETCPVAGCPYKGHPSVMDKHINALHTSGLFEKFKKFSTPEEIAAWREERRKRYPTVANVMLKQKAKEQRQKRGERLDSNNQRFGKVNDRKRAQLITQHDKSNDSEKRRKEENKTNCKNKKGRKNKHNKKVKNLDFKLKTQAEVLGKNKNLEEEAKFSCNGIKMFTGTCQLENYKHFNNKVITNNVLFGLVGMYGSEDDDESEENNEDGESNLEIIEMSEANLIFDGKCDINLKETNSEELENNVTLTTDKIHKNENLSTLSTTTMENTVNSFIDKVDNCFFKENDNSSDEAPEEKPIERNIPDCPNKSTNNPKMTSSDEPEARQSQLLQQKANSKEKHLLTRKSGLDYRKARLRKQNTMLEKLLESDIRHERNVLLQCVRYVCENNFFNIGQNKNEECLDENK